MDIVQRLKAFMNASQITSMQFADACGIPRPSLSQILNGRNKKISDEVIAKIHDAYPSLSVMWLLFGEGNMFAGGKQSSAAASSPLSSSSAFSTDAAVFDGDANVASNPTIDFGMGSTMAGETEDAAVYGHSYTVIPPDDAILSATQQSEARPPRPRPQAELHAATVQVPADGTKTITNIMVFYSDNSYQSFIPR